MAGALKKAGTRVDRQITNLKMLMNLTTGTVEHRDVREALRELRERWKIYEPLYGNT